MNRKYLLGGVAAAAALAAGGVGLDAAVSQNGAHAGSLYGASSPAPAGAASSVATAALAPGTALVDGAGRTLYLFEADTPATSACNGACAQVWPPLLTDGAMPTVSSPVQARLLGAVTRGDGSRQVTYNHHPLYLYVGDKQRGDAHGQGLDQFGAGWYVVTAAGDKIDSGDEAPAPAPAAGANW
jgi:predicted lipoprotein with Yx(FWY)xxD motif